MKEFLTTVYLAGLRQLTAQYDTEKGASNNTLGAMSMREWAAEKGRTDLVFRKHADLVLRDLGAFVGLLVAGRAGPHNPKSFELRLESIRAMAPLFQTQRHPKYVKLIAQHLRDVAIMPKAYLHWAQACFCARRTLEPFSAQFLDELHETMINLETKASTKRVHQECAWMLEICQYLPASTQMSIVWVEQVFQRTKRAPAMQEQQRTARSRRQIELLRKIVKEFDSKKALEVVPDRTLVSPWDETVSAAGADADNVLDDYSRGAERFKTYVMRYIFKVSMDPVVHKAPIRMKRRAKQRSVLKKQNHELEQSYRCLKRRVANAAENGLGLETLLDGFQSVPLPLALCNTYGEKHDSGKAVINKGMKKILTQQQFVKHRSERRPDGQYVYAIDMLTLLYKTPADSLETFQQYFDHMVSVTAQNYVNRRECLALILSFDKAAHMPETKEAEQQKRRAGRQATHILECSASGHLRDHLQEEIPRGETQWAALCASTVFRKQLIHCLCEQTAEQLTWNAWNHRTAVVLDGHCLDLADEAGSDVTPIAIRRKGISAPGRSATRSRAAAAAATSATYTPLDRREFHVSTVTVEKWLANKIGESDLAVIYLGLRVADYMNSKNLIIQSSDTDVWMAALSQRTTAYEPLSALGGTCCIYRPATGSTSAEYIDICATQTIITDELSLSIAEFCYLFALAGTDFTSGIANFSHTTIIQTYKEERTWITQAGAQPLAEWSTDGQHTFSDATWQRLVLLLYYNRSKGGENAVNYILEGGDPNRGQSLDNLLGTGCESDRQSAYLTVQTKVHKHTGKESLSLPSWGAMLRHAARAQWVSKYHGGIYLNTPPALRSSCDTFVPTEHDPTALTASMVRGWVRVNGKLRFEWDEGVVESEQQESVTERDKPKIPKGCGCKGGESRGPCGGGCGCKRKGRRCGAYCACSGGPNCCNPKNPSVPGTFATTSTPQQLSAVDAALGIEPDTDAPINTQMDTEVGEETGDEEGQTGEEEGQEEGEEEDDGDGIDSVESEDTFVDLAADDAEESVLGGLLGPSMAENLAEQQGSTGSSDEDGGDDDDDNDDDVIMMMMIIIIIPSSLSSSSSSSLYHHHIHIH
jgi:hypothetical protein